MLLWLQNRQSMHDYDFPFAVVVLLAVPLYRIIISTTGHGYSSSARFLNEQNMRPLSKEKQMPNKRAHASKSSCAFKNYHLFLLWCTCSPVCISTLQHGITQRRHTNKSLHKHVAQQISHVQWCSVQAQIMFLITVQWLQQSPGNICWGKWDSCFPVQTQAHRHINTERYHEAQAVSVCVYVCIYHKY